MDLHIHTLFARCSHVAAAREDAAVGAGGGDQGTGVAGRRSAIRRDELRAMCQTAGLAVKSNGKLLTVPQLQEALLAF